MRKVLNPFTLLPNTLLRGKKFKTLNYYTFFSQIPLQVNHSNHKGHFCSASPWKVSTWKVAWLRTFWHPVTTLKNLMRNNMLKKIQLCDLFHYKWIRAMRWDTIWGMSQCKMHRPVYEKQLDWKGFKTHYAERLIGSLCVKMQLCDLFHYYRWIRAIRWDTFTIQANGKCLGQHGNYASWARQVSDPLRWKI